MAPPHRDPLPSSDALDALNSSVDTLKCRDPPGTHGFNLKDSDTRSTFLGMPAMGVNMDVRKWNWPGYLTFGKGTARQGPDQIVIPASEKEKTVTEEEISHVEVEVNASALEDAISSDSLSISRLLTHPEGQGEAQDENPNINGADDLPTSPLSVARPDIDSLPPAPPSPPPLPEFSMTRLHLAPLHTPVSTTPVTVHYFIVSIFSRFPTLLLTKRKRNQVMLALIENEENEEGSYDVEVDDLEAAAKDVLRLFDEVDSTIYDAEVKRYVFIIHSVFDPSLTRGKNVAYLNLCLRLPKFFSLKIGTLSQQVNIHRSVPVFHRNQTIYLMQWLRFHR